MDELCNLPEAIRGELESVSSSRMLLPSSSEPRPGVSWSEMIGLSPVFFVPVRRRMVAFFSDGLVSGAIGTGSPQRST
jgi:hypothetical protein